MHVCMYLRAVFYIDIVNYDLQRLFLFEIVAQCDGLVKPAGASYTYKRACMRSGM